MGNSSSTESLSKEFSNINARKIDESVEADVCNKYCVVAAIDFGTTYSGYAFSFLDPNKIVMNSNWKYTGGSSYKTATSVLVDDEGKFVAFGFEAEDKYIQGALTKPPLKHHLFRKFKMELHQQTGIKLSGRYIKSEDGYGLRAMDVFAMAIKHLREHLIDAIHEARVRGITNKDIRWVITVPAIWSEEAKKFMREAAYKAGCMDKIDSEQLIIALEPEAASYICRQQLEAELNSSLVQGMKYLILDCGGGTNDMVVHEFVSQERVKELCAVNGGEHGGQKFNDRVIEFLEEVLGKEKLNNYQTAYSMPWYNFTLAIESAKQNTKPGQEMRFPIPLTLGNYYGNVEIENAFLFKEHLGISLKQGFICLSPDLVTDILNGIVCHITNTIDEELCKRHVEKLDFVFLVGGFSECQYLQGVLKENLKDKVIRKVIIPHDPQLAIVKGAVLYGLKPNLIVSRVARLTYGVPCQARFDDNIHDPEKKHIDKKGIKWCRGILETFVKEGEDVPTDSVKEHVLDCYIYDDCSTTCRILGIPRPPHTPVQYTSDDDVREIGKVPYDLVFPSGKDKIEHSIKMSFGRTEISVAVENKDTRKKSSTTLQFV